MTLLRVILFPITTVLQVALILGAYWALSIGLYHYVSPFMPGYYEDSALADVQALLLMALLWDRFWGPSSHLLREVGRVLNAAKHEQEED